MTDTLLLEQAASLREEIGKCNAAIRLERKKRQRAQAKLAELAAICQRLGIAFQVVPQHSTKGAVHDTDPDSIAPPRPERPL